MENSVVHTGDPLEDQNALLQVLAWHRSVGVDCTVAPAPADHFALFAQQQKARQQAQQKTQRPQSQSHASQGQRGHASPKSSLDKPLGTFEATKAAKALVQNITDLDTLHQAIAQFDGCAYRRTASRTVTHVGTTTPKVLIILNAPDDTLDKGQDFYGTGRGATIGRMMDAIHVPRETVCITHSVFWRPPSNSTPKRENVAICQPFLLKQIALLNPDFVLCFGSTPIQSVVKPAHNNTPSPIAKVRGQWQTGLWHNAPANTIMPTLSHDIMHKDPSKKRLVWQDLLALYGRIHSGEDS